MARYRPRKPHPAHESRRKARTIAAAKREPRLSDLAGGDPLGILAQVGEAMIEARLADFDAEIPDRAFGFEDFWEDER